ncbi:MAG: glycosyltransferase family 2 protein [Patescibacteria group bacterium]|nr:glycosyltransferase family 2 protein [Patescibacteria group bacterium]
MEEKYYLKVGRASDLKNPKDRRIYRFFEIFPGAVSWFTLLILIFLSWLLPFWVAIFIISFVLYWLTRTVYFSFHLRSCYSKMKKCEKIDWMQKLNNLKDKKWTDIYQLIIFPTYKESLEIVRASMQSLIKSDYPNEKMIVVLTAEKKGGEETRRIAETIEKEFKDKFFKFLLTYHPSDIENEIAGKGANENWGARRAKEIIIDKLNIPYKNIIVSCLDVDTYIFPKYFSRLSYCYLTVKNPLRCSFQPVPFFINNIWQTPPVSRIFSFSSSFWHMMCQERPEKVTTFSSHSMSFETLVDVDFQQVNVVSEDSRIFWQCFLKYDGNYRVVPMYYPISMDANVASTFLKTMRNVYKQQRRWAYGVENAPYYFFGFMKNKKIPFFKKISFGFISFEGYWSWATNSIMIFLLGWLPLVLGGREFNQTLFSYNLPICVRIMLTLAMFGLVGSAYLSIVLLPPKPPNYGKARYLFFVLEWFFLPLVMVFFTALPALEAQTRLMLGKYMGFWHTEKFRKKTS